MNDKYKNKSEIIASLKEAIVIDSFSRAQHGYIYLSFKDAPHIEYRLVFELKDFENGIDENGLNTYMIDEHEQHSSISKIARSCKPSMIIHCLKFGMSFKIDIVTENQTVKELFQQIEAMKAYLDTRLQILEMAKAIKKDELVREMLDSDIRTIEDIKANGWKTKKDLLNLNIQS